MRPVMMLRKRLAHSSRLFVWSAAGGGLLLLLAFFLSVAWDSYRSTVAASRQTVANIAALIEQDIARNFALYDLSLQAVIDGVADPEVMAEPPRLRQIALFDRSATAPGLGALFAIDASGNIFLDSRSTEPRQRNVADREYFQVHRDARADLGLHFSRPFRSRLQGNVWSISISRRLPNRNGSFAGIVSGTVKLDFIRDPFERVSLGHHGSISLFRDDGVLIVRNIEPSQDGALGRDWRSAPLFQHLDSRRRANFESSYASDDVPRFYAYQRVTGLPLTVAVGRSMAEVLTPFWNKIVVLAAIFAAMAASVLGLVWLLDGELRRREQEARTAASLARVDGLTGLGNRRRFDELLPQEWSRASRHDLPMSLIMLDIDHFKRFNDRYGHPEGDRVLAAVGTAIAEAVHRPGDFACRYGGEEFAVLLPGTPEQGARQIAEAIRKGVAGLGVPHAGSTLGHVTVSVGVATVTPGPDLWFAGLIGAADAALYRAKDRGRDRVVASNVVAAAFRPRAEEQEPVRQAG